MSLLRYLCADETLNDLEAAALSRAADGRALRRVERPYWAIYTLGYVAECCLKVAFLRVCGLTDRDTVRQWIRFAPAWGRHFGIRAGKSHDLLFWLELLKREREYIQRPMNPRMAIALGVRVEIIASHWRVDMRYRGSMPASTELRQVWAAAAWIVGNRRVLWS